MKKIFILFCFFQLQAGDDSLCEYNVDYRVVKNAFEIFDEVLESIKLAPWTIWKQSSCIGQSPVDEEEIEIKKFEDTVFF